jgi:septum site-determining protein MinC
MLTDPQRKSFAPQVLEFKSSTFFVPVLILYNNDLSAIEHALQEKIRQAPDFFRNSPLVFDVHALNKHNNDLDIVAFIDFLRELGLFPIGIRGGNEQQNKQAQKMFITVDAVRDSAAAETQKTVVDEPVRKSTPAEQTGASVSDSAPAPAPSATTLISQPIRSGQRIYAAGDLIILSQVSAGAEIMAEGNIHIYNTLRGRALAGVQGNKEARIFCFDLQAELISIAGDYKTSEDFDEGLKKKPVQIYLQDRALFIKDIAKT